MTKTEKYKILTKYIKDMSSETPDIETFLFVKKNIAKYQLNTDIKSQPLKNKLVEINTTLKYEDKEQTNKKSYFEIVFSTVIKVNEDVKEKLKVFESNGYKNLPVCIAKTQYSFSTDPKLKGAPSNHEIPIREVRLSSGAEFIVVVCGSIMTMPGLPKVPAANNIKLNKKGDVEGLF